jgi:hypothetical protein
MRIKEIMERVDPAYDPNAGFLRNIGRAGLNRFVRNQLGIDAYDDEDAEEKRSKKIEPVPAPDSTPNFGQGNVKQATVNAPVAAVPAIRPYVPQSSSADTATPAQAPAVDPAKPPEVYTLDGQPLNPNNPIHSRLIAQMQQQGITQAKTGTPKK